MSALFCRMEYVKQFLHDMTMTHDMELVAVVAIPSNTVCDTRTKDAELN